MIGRLAIVAGILVLLSVWTHARPRGLGVAPLDFASAVPLAFGEWVGRDAPPLDPDVAKVLAADQYVHRYYGWRTADRGSQIADRGSRTADRGPRTADRGSRTADRGSRTADRGSRIADVEFDLAYYRQPQAGAAMHSPLNCLPGNGWQVIDARPVPVTLDRATDARQLVIGRGATRIAMTYWFQNRGAMIGNEYRQRLQLLTNGLQGRPTDAALVRVMALDTPEGHAAMNRFTPQLASRLSARFR